MIAIVSRTEGVGSGAEIMLQHFLENWPDRYSFLIITARGSSIARSAGEMGYDVYELDFVAGKVWPNVKTLEILMHQIKTVRIVHAWASKSVEIAWYLSRRMRVPLTMSMHDHPQAKYLSPRKHRLMKWISNCSIGTVAVSKAVENACRQYGYHAQLTTIYNGLPPSTVSRKLEANSRVRIGFLGMNAPGKGFELIAEWIRKSSGLPDVEWLCFGDPCDSYQAITKMLISEGHKGLYFAGRRSAPDIFSTIDVLVHASTMFDSFPTVLLEAACAGVPSVASSSGGAPEIVVEGSTGFLFDCLFPEEGYKKLDFLISNENARKKFGRNARQRFTENFTIDKMLKGYSAFWSLNT